MNEEQINNVNLKLSKGIGLLAKIRHYVPKNTLRSLYFTFINPHIDYNILNWGMASPNILDTISKAGDQSHRVSDFVYQIAKTLVWSTNTSINTSR